MARDCPDNKTCNAMRKLFEKKAKEGDGAFAIAWALMDLSDAQEATARQLRMLGNGDSIDPRSTLQPGAIENLGKQVAEAATKVAGALEDIAQATRGS